ncbi:hypothetical protein [Rhizobium sp. RU20A]|uniref:YunG family protein n=1 Tax=Rhizobium sp. RU20A TaxID=1907412 RepID=UPI00165FD646|nr:hypothetical protein [Rhizobium sp. RU20A]
MSDHAVTIEEMRSILLRAWSIETSSLWRLDNPACGQCGVTALVVQDILGGDILKTKLDDSWHFYNRVGGRRIDFTETQFVTPADYQDGPASRDDAFADTTRRQYEHLRAAVGSLMPSAQ